MDLEELILKLDNLSINEKIAAARAIYTDTYLKNQTIGIHELHDAEHVIFHAKQFDHAFFKSSDLRLKPYDKSIPDEARIKRINWILEVIRGNVPNSACWEVISRGGRPGLPNRLYVVYKQNYVVWLEPRTPPPDRHPPVQWSFSSAYPANPKHVRDNTKGGHLIWTYKEQTKKDAP